MIMLTSLTHHFSTLSINWYISIYIYIGNMINDFHKNFKPKLERGVGKEDLMRFAF